MLTSPSGTRSKVTSVAISRHYAKRKPLAPGEGFSSNGLTNLFLRAAFDLSVLAAETLDAASGVDQLLLAREKRVAVRADFYVDVVLARRAGQETVATGAVNAHFVVVGMNSCLHET